jgi:hypothetical protein
MLREPFKVTAPSSTAVGYLDTNRQQRTRICQRPFINYVQLLTTALCTNLESVSNGANSILSTRMLLFFVGNLAMNLS